MFFTLVRKELLANLLTLRLSVALVFTVVLAVLTTLIGSLDFSRSVEAYQKERRQQQEELDRATVYSQLRPNVLVPPMPLSILCRGVVGTSSQSVNIEVSFVPVSAWSGQQNWDTPFLRTLVQLDFTAVVAVLLSFLAVVLGFDGICGERQAGTLKQVLANPVPRSQVVLAKLAGGALSLGAPFSLAFGISLLIVLANPQVQLTGDDWARLGLFLAISCIFLVQIYALSLLVSAFARDADVSLIVCLFGWLVGAVGYASLLPSFSRYGVNEPPFQELMDHNQRLWDEHNRKMQEWEAKNPPPGQGYLRGLEREGRLRYAHPEGYLWMQQRHAFEMDKHLEMADERYKYHWANWEPLAREAYLVDEWAILSPFTNYQVLSYQLSRTTLDDRFFLVKAGRRYRETFIEYLRTKGAFASRQWFTDDPEDQEPMIPDPESVSVEMLSPDSPFMQARLAWAEEQEKRAASDQRRRLDLTDLPKFGGEWKRSLGASLGVMVPGLSVLLLSTGAFALITLWRFGRYDPR